MKITETYIFIMLRLFIALNLPSDVIQEIKNISWGVKDARWVPQEQLHITLRFIGNCDEGRYYDIRDALKRVDMNSFSLSLKGVGYFPPRKKPRILWVGINQPDELIQMRSKIDTCLKQIGIENEGRKFHPHVTVARLHETIHPSSIIPFLSQNSLFSVSPFPITTFYLYSSTLQREGAIHRIEQTYTLQ